MAASTPPHRVEFRGTGSPMNPVRARCGLGDACGWLSGEFFGPAAKSKAILAGAVHERCPVCEGSRHRPGGDVCGTCDGSGYRPADLLEKVPAA